MESWAHAVEAGMRSCDERGSERQAIGVSKTKILDRIAAYTERYDMKP